MAKLIETPIKGFNQNWYVKVTHVKAENKGSAIATYGYFTDAQAAKDSANAIESQNLPFAAISDVDIFRQAYEAMSLLSEFEGAVDC